MENLRHWIELVENASGVLLVLQPDDFEAGVQVSKCPVTGKPCDCKDECLMPLAS